MGVTLALGPDRDAEPARIARANSNLLVSPLFDRWYTPKCRSQALFDVATSTMRVTTGAISATKLGAPCWSATTCITGSRPAAPSMPLTKLVPCGLQTQEVRKMTCLGFAAATATSPASLDFPYSLSG